jgi:hypothetical protein
VRRAEDTDMWKGLERNMGERQEGDRYKRSKGKEERGYENKTRKIIPCSVSTGFLLVLS